jgi:hypothetical protein
MATAGPSAFDLAAEADQHAIMPPRAQVQPQAERELHEQKRRGDEDDDHPVAIAAGAAEEVGKHGREPWGENGRDSLLYQRRWLGRGAGRAIVARYF